MTSLKSFIVVEEIKASHAAKYFDYIENHHLDIAEEIGEELEARWGKDVEKISKFEPNEHRLADLQLKNSNAFVGVELDTRSLALQNRFSKRLFTSTSVKYSLTYKDADRARIKSMLLQTAIDTFKEVLGRHPGIFGLTRSEKIKYLFSITHEDDLVKLLFKTTNENKEQISKTIFIVGVEHGSLTNGSKPFNRVYLTDYTK